MQIQIHTDHNINGHETLIAAADKLTHMIESTIGRRHHQESHRTDPPLPEAELSEPS